MKDLNELADLIVGLVNDVPTNQARDAASVMKVASEMVVIEVEFRGKTFKVVVSEAVG